LAAHKLRILFADDERSLQEFMRSELPRLGARGHRLSGRQDGRQALEKAAFDAAILDLRMPGLTGIEVLDQIKQVSPDTEVVIMTGHASMETAIEAVRLGAFGLRHQAVQADRNRNGPRQGQRKARPQAQGAGPAKPGPGRGRPHHPGV